MSNQQLPQLDHNESHSNTSHRSAGDVHNKPDYNADIITGLQQRAATLIQKTYRGHRTRREMKGLGISANTRWTQALREAEYREMTRPRARPVASKVLATEGKPGRSSRSEKEQRRDAVKFHWRKVGMIAKRANADMDGDDVDDESSDDSGASHGISVGCLDSIERREHYEAKHERRAQARAERQKAAKTMGIQYFLEMVDLKHRYGSNLRSYHQEWQKADTHDNFFYWLDHGEGRDVEVAGVPRERLDREQVRYLSREDRQYYLVEVDREGRLCWAKNGQYIDTTEQYKDSMNGIVSKSDPTPAFKPISVDSQSNSDADGDLAEISESEVEGARAAKHASPGVNDAKGVKNATHITPATIFNTLLRKSVKKNTWIFVADTSFRLYVGIKDSGSFQHSSFLQGSRISAAGLIKIKDGKLASLSPLSGHYRPPAANFRAFVRSLKEEGVNMKHVSISKSYMVLVGLELYLKTKARSKEVRVKAVHAKDRVVHPLPVDERDKAGKDKSDSVVQERETIIG